MYLMGFKGYGRPDEKIAKLWKKLNEPPPRNESLQIRTLPRGAITFTCKLFDVFVGIFRPQMPSRKGIERWLLPPLRSAPHHPTTPTATKRRSKASKSWVQRRAADTAQDAQEHGAEGRLGAIQETPKKECGPPRKSGLDGQTPSSVDRSRRQERPQGFNDPRVDRRRPRQDSRRDDRRWPSDADLVQDRFGE